MDQEPDQPEFERIVRTVIGQLPGWVQSALREIDIRILDEPGELDAAEDPDLLGLYVGLPLTEREANHFGELPDAIYLFRLPHLELGLPEDELHEEIAKTLIHEIAHHFGIDDDHLDEIGWG